MTNALEHCVFVLCVCTVKNAVWCLVSKARPLNIMNMVISMNVITQTTEWDLTVQETGGDHSGVKTTSSNFWLL